MNSITTIAEEEGRDYITPEDIGEALRRGTPVDTVRLDVLQVLGKQTTFGAEDRSLCAFLAFKGTAD